MLTKHATKLLFALTGLCAGLWATDGHAETVKYTGGFTSGQVECDTMCTGGPLTGGLAGELAWRMDTMTATANPDVVTYTGVDTVTTADGTLSGPDYGIWNLATGEFVDYLTITSGTGKYAGARGTLVIIGKFDPVTGTGTSEYTAVVFTP